MNTISIVTVRILAFIQWGAGLLGAGGGAARRQRAAARVQAVPLDYVYIYIYIYIHTHLYTYIYIYTHTHTITNNTIQSYIIHTIILILYNNAIITTMFIFDWSANSMP